ncbi:MAG: HNH endonuclease [Prochlorotrichaceae cyanobacterium]
MKRRFSHEQKTLLLIKHGWKCAYCGCDIDYSCHIDHVIPFSEGGSTTLQNGVPSCAKCNRRKSNNVCDRIY